MTEWKVTEYMFSSVISNKKVWYILGVLVTAAAIVVAGMFIFTDSASRSVSAKNSTDTAKVQSIKIDDSTKHANALYNDKVCDVNDTALVAELFEVMGLEDTVGEYSVQISQEDDIMILALNAAEPVQKTDKKVFNSNMRKFAQQMLVLIPQIDRVQWTYQIAESKSSSASNVATETSSSGESDSAKSSDVSDTTTASASSTGEAVVKALDKEEFEETLGKSPEYFAKSADTVKKLLEKQAGK